MKFDNPTMARRAFMRALGMDPDTEHVTSITVRVAVGEVARITVERLVTKDQTPGILAGLVELRPDAVIIDDVVRPTNWPVVHPLNTGEGPLTYPC